MDTVTIRKELDELIDFYEAHGRPGAGRRISVKATPRDLAHALDCPFPRDSRSEPAPQREFNYRGRVIVAVGCGA